MKNTTHFDSAAQTWDTEEIIKRNEALAQKIKKHLTQPMGRLLDFGCGTGLLLSHFINQANELVGIETSQGMLVQFNERFQGVHSVKSFAINLEHESLPPTIGFFDVVVTAMAFHHLKKPQLVLKKLKEHLNAKGIVFVIDLGEEDGTFHPDNQGMGVQHFGFSKETLESWSQDIGFDSFQHETVYEIFKNNRIYKVNMGIFHL